MPKRKSSPFSVEWPMPSNGLPTTLLPVKTPAPAIPQCSEPQSIPTRNGIEPNSAKPSKGRSADEISIKLAKRIVSLLKNEELRDSLRALQIAKILLPPASAKRKNQHQQEDADAESAGALEPADEFLMRASKAMSAAVTVAPREIDEEETL